MIPDFKYFAVYVSLGGVPPQLASYGGGQLLAALSARSGELNPDAPRTGRSRRVGSLIAPAQ